MHYRVLSWDLYPSWISTRAVRNRRVSHPLAVFRIRILQLGLPGQHAQADDSLFYFIFLPLSNYRNLDTGWGSNELPGLARVGTRERAAFCGDIPDGGNKSSIEYAYIR